MEQISFTFVTNEGYSSSIITGVTQGVNESGN